MSVSALESKIVRKPVRLWFNPRAVLDTIYLWSGYASAASILLILAATMTQIVTRYLGIRVSGLSSYAGYLMAASTFFGLAYALNCGAHIRIETISKLFGKRQIYLDLFAFGTGAVIATWFAWYSCSMVHWTYILNDISTELDATPLWIPQMSMAIGTVLFAVAMIDNFLTLLLTGKPRIQPGTEAI